MPLRLGAENNMTSPPPACSLVMDKHFGRLGAGQFVGLGQDDQEFQAFFDAGTYDVEQNFVQFGHAVARVAHQHNAVQVFAGDQVVGHDLLPADLVLFGNRGIPIAGQIGQNRVG